MNFIIKHFTCLTLKELYTLLTLRSEVFVVEQNCIYLDMDNLDQDCYHLLAYDEENGVENVLVGYLRIIKPGVKCNEWSIGRVCNSSSSRGKGYGKKVVSRAIEWVEAQQGITHDISISAQNYLLKFYNDLGFKEYGSVYMHDGIEHIDMRKCQL
jgi:ElaA protein